MEPRDLTREIAAVAQNYHFARQPSIIREVMEWLAKKLRWLGDLFREFFRPDVSAIDSHGLGTALQLLVFAIGSIGLIALILALIRRAKSQIGTAPQSAKGADSVEELKDAASWRKHAEQLAKAADYEGACRALYLSMLHLLDEQSIAAFSPTRTNYEYSYALARYPDVQKRFRQMAEHVEIVSFGSGAGSGVDYHQVCDLWTDLNAQIQSIEEARMAPSVAKP